jgi:hypothetical protein
MAARQTRHVRTNALPLTAIAALVRTACTASSAPGTAAERETTESCSDAPRTYARGEFPEFPQAALLESTGAALQARLHSRRGHTVKGVTAAVIVADHGSWTGPAGSRMASSRMTHPRTLDLT